MESDPFVLVKCWRAAWREFKILVDRLVHTPKRTTGHWLCIPNTQIHRKSWAIFPTSCPWRETNSKRKPSAQVKALCWRLFSPAEPNKVRTHSVGAAISSPLKLIRPGHLLSGSSDIHQGGRSMSESTQKFIRPLPGRHLGRVISFISPVSSAQ